MIPATPLESPLCMPLCLGQPALDAAGKESSLGQQMKPGFQCATRTAVLKHQTAPGLWQTGLGLLQLVQLPSQATEALANLPPAATQTSKTGIRYSKIKDD